MLAYEVEETRMVNVRKLAVHSPMNWRPVYRWRRIRFGGAIDLQGTATGVRIAAHVGEEL